MTEAAQQPATSYGSLIVITKAVGDVTRAHILRCLERDSFGVLELAEIVDIAQPALSHHLKILLNAGLVAKRREGNRVFYRRALAAASGNLADLVGGIFEQLDADALPIPLAARIRCVYARRSQQSRAFFGANADNFASQQALISSTHTYGPAVIEQLAGATGSALEIGPGDGALLAPLANQFDRVTAIDDTPQMLERARPQAAGLGNVTLRRCAFEALPARRKFNAIVAAMVLHHSPSPSAFVSRAATLLASGGRIVVAELAPHDQEWVRDACGDLWLGFAEDELDGWAKDAGLIAGPAQYLAQKNGFRIQIKTYSKEI